MSLNDLLRLFLVFVLGFFCGLCIKYLYESTAFQPYSWDKGSKPIIANCYGPDFSKLQMIRAIDYWTIRGHDIGFYEHNPPESVCKQTWLEGFIILRKSEKLNRSEKTLANTKRYTSFASMRGAVINYRPGTQNLDLINEHELGHALGYTHVEVVGHVMHPTYGKMGSKFWVP